MGSQEFKPSESQSSPKKRDDPYMLGHRLRGESQSDSSTWEQFGNNNGPKTAVNHDTGCAKVLDETTT